MSALVLIAEDESEIANIIRVYLERARFRTVVAENGKVAIELHQALKPDIILLDISMPKVDGWKVLSTIRQRDTTPIIVITALDQDLDKLQALRTGADDYVVKPFNPMEIVARVQAVLRRSTNQYLKSMIRVGDLEIDPDNYTVKINFLGKESKYISLTLAEFRILLYMASNPSRVYSRSEIVDACLLGGDSVDRTVDSHISRVRKKLIDAGENNIFENVRGVGYRLVCKK